MQECLESKSAYLNSMCSNRRKRADRVPKVCKEDIEALCPMDVSDEAHHLVCLRKHRNKITQKCWDELSELGSEGWEVLPNRFKQISVDTECSAALASGSAMGEKWKASSAKALAEVERFKGEAATEVALEVAAKAAMEAAVEVAMEVAVEAAM